MRLPLRSTVLILLTLSALFAKTRDAAADDSTFELRNGDRVVLLGGTFVERLQSYGYLELLLTTSTEDVKFRNLGWSGDDVWGTARAVFGTQQDGFKRLIDDVQMAKPSVILVAYGANEAFGGEAGVPKFVSGLAVLLDELAKTGARLGLVAPPHQERLRPGLPDPTSYNKNLRHYADAIRQVAQKRSIPFIDPYNPVADAKLDSNKRPRIRDRLTDNGIHFSPYGYWRLGPPVAAKLGVRQSTWRVDIEIDQASNEAVGTTLSELGAKPEAVRFVATDSSLPYAVPPQFSPRGADMLAPHGVLKIKGLKPGKYGLRIDERPAVMANHEQWTSGVHINLGQYTPQVEQLRQAIIAKNSLFFYRYRPQNETYLFLFRKHEQGNNAVEVPQFEQLVAEKEAEIAKLKVPRKRVYQLIKLKPSEGDIRSSDAPTQNP